MRLRQSLLLVTLAAAAALPVLVYFAVQADNRYRGLQLSLAALQRQEAELAGYARHVDRFRAHAAVMAHFAGAAERAGAGPAHWNSHRVDIERMFIPYAELDDFMAGMSTVRDAHFVPETLVMETRPTVTHADAAAAGGRSEVFAGGVTLTLTGEFLVAR